jgi:imidazolonepropionase
MPLLKNISILYTCRPAGKQADVHAVHNAALVWNGQEIIWTGEENNLPDEYLLEYDILDANGKIVIPGLIDCHTHLCFGGWRAGEFEKRLSGVSYLEIAKSGGGILSTVKETRKASEDELYKKASTLLDEIIRTGVTAIECKSGYGLSTEEELKQLRVYKRLAELKPVRIVSTFLGAHTIPPEYQDNREGYIELIINEMIPAVAREKLAVFCDVFAEESAFTISEARRILETAKSYGLTPKIHADQLTSGGGAELAAETGAVSADHLERVSDTGIQRMAESGVVGVSLPIASLYTYQPYLNCRRLVEGGVDVAVATDFNPGSAPSPDLPMAMMLACNHGRLTPAEALKAATIYAAKAIRLEKETGSLEPGKSADFNILDAPDINHWIYHFKRTPPLRTFASGSEIEN